MSTVEDLWKKLEISKPRLTNSFEDDTDDLSQDTDGQAHENRARDSGSYGDPFDISPEGDLGDIDSELELINLNPRSSREFSLSKYEVGIKHFSDADGVDIHRGPRGHKSHEYVNELEEGEEVGDDEYYDERYSKKVSVLSSYEGEVNSIEDEADSGHVICDCEDCINQTEAVDCHCENCVQAREATLHSPPTSNPREITCDCEDCLNHSGSSYTCDCENCEKAARDEVLNFNNNHPDDFCKCSECVDQGLLHQTDRCNCSQCSAESGVDDTASNSHGATDVYRSDFKQNLDHEFQPLEKPNGMLKTKHRSAFLKGNNANQGKGDNSAFLDPGAVSVQYDNPIYFTPDVIQGAHRSHVDAGRDPGSPSEGSLEGISFSEDLLTESDKECGCESCVEEPPTRHTRIQQPIEPDITP